MKASHDTRHRSDAWVCARMMVIGSTGRCSSGLYTLVAASLGFALPAMTIRVTVITSTTVTTILAFIRRASIDFAFAITEVVPIATATPSSSAASRTFIVSGESIPTGETAAALHTIVRSLPCMEFYVSL